MCKTLNGERRITMTESTRNGGEGFLCSLNKNVDSEYMPQDGVFRLILFTVYLKTLPIALTSTGETIGEELTGNDVEGSNRCRI
jgi:hypothetical protein